jgi:hypothetical protein
MGARTHEECVGEGVGGGDIWRANERTVDLPLCNHFSMDGTQYFSFSSETIKIFGYKYSSPNSKYGE